MATIVLPALAVLAAYLIGSIPFGLLVARWAGGVDIRTVGSGNIGATNVGRVLGFRYFVVVFLLDAFKGLGPTLATAHWLGAGAPAAAVAAALATILGHNYPIYLNFRGGKGVATSLGAVLALDPFAGVACGLAFVAFVLLTRYVSVASILGALVFVVVHFARQDDPWSRGQLAMSAVTLGLFAMLAARHRKNWRRVAEGTEPRVSLRRKEAATPGPDVPTGRTRALVVVAMAAVAVAAAVVAAVVARGRRPATLDLGPYTIAEVSRAATGHQRAERVAFADDGRVLAVTCPRYNRVVLLRVTPRKYLSPIRDVALEGRPVALCAGADRLYVLQRPAGDARHIEEAWWDEFDFAGRRLGGRVRVGFDPDDIALVAGGAFAAVVTSGRAEGEANRPAPALVIFDLSASPPRPVGRLEFDGPKDDPERITLSSRGLRAVVSLHGSNQGAAVDLADPTRPALLGRWDLPARDAPYPSRDPADGESILMPVSTRGISAAAPAPGDPPGTARFLVRARSADSGIEVFDAEGRRRFGRLDLRGTLGLGTIRPAGLAVDPGRRLVAVANWDGGSVHLLEFSRKSDADPDPGRIARR